MPAVGEVYFGHAIATHKEENLAIAEEDPDSDACDPFPPLPHEQAGLPSREISTQTLTVYPRSAANIPGAYGPVADPDGYPEALHDMRLPWNIFHRRFKFEVRQCSLGLLCGVITWVNTFVTPRLSFHCVRKITTLCWKLGDWLNSNLPLLCICGRAAPIARASYAERIRLRIRGVGRVGEPRDTLRADVMCPNMRMALSALRYDCDAYSSHTSGELCRRMDRNHHRSVYGGGYLVVFVPSRRGGPSAVFGGPLHSGEPSGSSADNPVGPVVPCIFLKGEGKNYSLPPWYNHHLAIPDPPSRDEEEAAVENH